MAEKQETIADIVAEMRAYAKRCREENFGVAPECEAHYSEDDVEDLADRLEAALKREKAEIEADALAAGGIVEAARHKPGNAAAMREALQSCLDTICRIVWIDDPEYDEDGHYLGANYAAVSRDKARAALSAPPRNCDRLPNSAAAIEAYREETGLNTHPVQLWLAPQIYAFIDWLLAQATERKGDNDGSK